ncbi:MAG: M23 family metallopeptidase [Maricaulaceae bacterium]|jgi:murein DD-endopeptidase MepM/ murein hydrolase activator NlpD
MAADRFASFIQRAAASAAVAALTAGCGAVAQDAADDPATSGPLSIACHGQLAQGGLALCQTAPGATVEIGGEPASIADDEGWASLGFARDAASSYEVRAVAPDGEISAPVTLEIADREFIESEVGGLDCDYVAPPRTPEVQAAIARAVEQKNAAWRSFADGEGALGGFIAPGDGDQTSPYGSRRRKYGEGCETVSVHWGLDLRAPEGSPVNAPASGVVTLADNLYFEGGAVFLDHGHGLVSIFMHMSEITVEEGDVVGAGDQLGLAGMTGTANGPHIHWGLKWRNPHYADGTTGAFYIDPILAMEVLGE